MRLHWTINTQAALKKSSEKYRPTENNYDLPELFWKDLSDVLILVATSQAASFFSQKGHYLADQLVLFIKRVQRLVDSGSLTNPQRSLLKFTVVVGLVTYGVQSGDSTALKEAVEAYRELLKEYTRERVPPLWAATQINLGNALTRLGRRESGTARLEEAVAAYREALKEYTRERVPLDWAWTQNNLGNALENARGTGERDGAAGGGRGGVS